MPHHRRAKLRAPRISAIGPITDLAERSFGSSRSADPVNATRVPLGFKDIWKIGLLLNSALNPEVRRFGDSQAQREIFQPIALTWSAEVCAEKPTDVANFRPLALGQRIFALEWLAERVGFEPTIRTHDTVSRIHAFQACALSHSAISPAPVS